MGPSWPRWEEMEIWPGKGDPRFLEIRKQPGAQPCPLRNGAFQSEFPHLGVWI